MKTDIEQFNDFLDENKCKWDFYQQFKKEEEMFFEEYVSYWNLKKRYYLEGGIVFTDAEANEVLTNEFWHGLNDKWKTICKNINFKSKVWPQAIYY